MEKEYLTEKQRAREKRNERIVNAFKELRNENDTAEVSNWQLMRVLARRYKLEPQHIRKIVIAAGIVTPKAKDDNKHNATS